MFRVVLQAGHENAVNNCDAGLKRSTGAPGEAEFTVRIRNRLSQILISKGFQLFLVDSTYNCNSSANKEDYNLFLAIHYDAYINGSIGGFCDYPEPSTDFATVESQRITKTIASEYFKHSGIQEVNRSNINTRFYYMWKFLSAKTPCVLIECGTGQNPHDKVILADTERVCNALARGICKSFNVPFDPVSPPTPPVDYKAKFATLTAQFDAFKNTSREEKLLLEDKIKTLETKIQNAKQSLA